MDPHRQKQSFAYVQSVVHIVFLHICRYAYIIQAMRQTNSLIDALMVKNQLEPDLERINIIYQKTMDVTAKP